MKLFWYLLFELLGSPIVENMVFRGCLLYTSDAADEGLGVDLGGRRIIKKKSEKYLIFE